MPAFGAPIKRNGQEKTYASYRSLNAAALAIYKAKNPLILVGNETIRAQSSKALTEFITTLNIPVVNTLMGKGALPYTHPLALWTLGLQQRDLISYAFEKCSLVIAVGYDLIEYSPKTWNPERTTPIIHIGMETAEIDSSYIPLVEVVGDISDSLMDIL
jgi:acetolactate synthase-1/2/3 large subunit